MSTGKRHRHSRAQKTSLGGQNDQIKEKPTNVKEVLKYGQSSSEDNSEHAEDALKTALKYFEEGSMKTLRSKGQNREQHFKIVENVAWKNGLSPERIDTLLNVALSGKFGTAVNTRILKCLIPTTLIAGDSVLKAVSWLCVGKCAGSIKVLFFRWLIAMFDFIDQKDQVNLLYGFFFASLEDDILCPYVCHLLYLLTKKENVKPFRIRKLLAIQAKMGMQPHLQALLSMYKLHAPTLISVSLPTRNKICFKNSGSLWQMALIAVRQRNTEPSPVSLKLTLHSANIRPIKQKCKSDSLIPESKSTSYGKECGQKEMSLPGVLSNSCSFPIEQLRSFPQLLENIHCLELPGQMGSMLNNSLLLHYINCVKDESISLRFYHWLSQTLQEECLWYKLNKSEYKKHFTSVLDSVIKAQHFLQEGFYSCEVFLYKSLPLWDGDCCRIQFLQLVSWIPFSNFSELKPLIFDHLSRLFFTSTIYFKCSVLQSLKELLQNWLLWLSVEVNMKVLSNSLLETTVGESANSVLKLIQYVGWLSMNGLRLERNHPFLMHIILDFYEKVCDIYLNYNIPIIEIFPLGIFYPALFSLDACTFNQLCYIMHRYHKNLTAVKKNEFVKKKKTLFNFNKKTYQEFNRYLTAMVSCFWTSNCYQKGFYHEIIDLDPWILEEAGLTNYRHGLNLVHNPALVGYAVSFLLQDRPEARSIKVRSIQGKKWNWYVDYLFSEGLQGLKLFVKNSIRPSTRNKNPNDEREMLT
ncbi:centromere protein I [Tenrec ecaudatus]|uniref:centromere protein I n=1 Tax=Tenrec ecaudatus TaxID=94439 RepID=UPI003F592280